MSHTPGPWEAVFDSCASCGGEWIITGPPSGDHGQFTNEADARLIAAAPELLAALKAVEAHHVKLNVEAGRDEGRSRTLAMIRSAIAKAEQ